MCKVTLYEQLSDHRADISWYKLAKLINIESPRSTSYAAESYIKPHRVHNHPAGYFNHGWEYGKILSKYLVVIVQQEI